MFPQIDTPSGGPLTAADLDRATNTGRIYHLHRIVAGRDTCNGDCETQAGCGCFPMPAEACTNLGADTRPAALSMERHNRTAGRVVLALLTIPAIAAVAAVGAFIAQHLR